MKRSKPPEIDKKKEKLQFIIDSLSHGWLPEERETSILFDHNGEYVYLETSYPPTARRWFENLYGDPDIKWDTKADTLKLKVPKEYCRKSDLIIKAKFREFDD